MKRCIIVIICLFFFTSSLVLAQEDHHDDDEGHFEGGGAHQAVEHEHSEVPKEYDQDKYYNNPYWADKIDEYEEAKVEGKRLYNINCANCHGDNGGGEIETGIIGVPVLTSNDMIAEMSAAFWFFRISEGVDQTIMPPYKAVLSDDAIWKIMTYEHTFTHDAPHIHEDLKVAPDSPLKFVIMALVAVVIIVAIIKFLK